MKIRAYQPGDEDAVVGLWQRCGLAAPQNDPRADIRRKLQVAPELFLVGESDDAEIVATVMAGYDGHRGWINYLAVSPEQQGRGLGRRVVQHVEALLRRRGCPKINLQVRTSNAAVMAFYRAIGFTPDDVSSMGKRLIVDDPAGIGNQGAITSTVTEAVPEAAEVTHDDIYCAQVIPGHLAVRKVAETERLLAFHHTHPYWPVHVVIVPKKHIPSLAAVAAEDWPIVQEMLTLAGELCRQITEEHGGCRLSTNSGDHQSTPHLHFYIHSGSRIRDEHGNPIEGTNIG